MGTTLHHQIIFSGFLKIKSSVLRDNCVNLACKMCVENDITGLTLFDEGSFLATLEGKKTRLMKVFEYCQDYQGLSEVTLIMQNSISQREFESFRIGATRNDFSEDIPQMFKLNQQSYKTAIPENVSPHLAILTQSFARVNSIC